MLITEKRILGSALNPAMLFFGNADAFTGCQLKIYDERGLSVYNTTDYKNDWDGGGLPDATYFYIIELEKNLSKTGCVTIVR